MSKRSMLDFKKKETKEIELFYYTILLECFLFTTLSVTYCHENLSLIMMILNILISEVFTKSNIILFHFTSFL